jgi:hypothetical protein
MSCARVISIRQDAAEERARWHGSVSQRLMRFVNSVLDRSGVASLCAHKKTDRGKLPQIVATAAVSISWSLPPPYRH